MPWSSGATPTRPSPCSAISRSCAPATPCNLGCLGDLLKAKGLSEEAGETLEAAVVAGREAIRLKPDAASAHANLARALLRQDKLDEAIAELRTVKRLEPNHSFTWPGSVSGGPSGGPSRA